MKNLPATPSLRAAERCKAHFQGDKCRLPEGHTGDHVSALHQWNEKSKMHNLHRQKARP